MKEYYEKHKANCIAAVVVILLLIIGISVHTYNSHRLKGTYTGTVSILFFTGKDQITFSKDKTFTEGDPEQKESDRNKGTYELSGDQLKLKLDKSDEEITAKLSSDRKSFVIKDAKGVAGLANGTKYKLDE